MFIRLISIITILMLVTSPDGLLARKKKKETKKEPPIKEELFKGLEYRSIGPFRGGRSAAVTGVPGEPATFYFGGTGGGVWRTEDGGSNWTNISDGFFGGSIGAVAVSEWDPNVIYVGGGEKTVRGNVSHGNGVWKSVDRGKTWKHMGLKDSRHIPRIRIHPRNPDLIYVAALGHLFGPNEMRGVYRSADGGQTWEKILFVSDFAGAVDLLLDPTNPRIIYAGFWRVKRTPYSLESGGKGSGLWKSTDGGDTWKEISRNKGLPQGRTGIYGVTVSPVNANRVWAMVEAEDGGLFRSENGGETWTKINEERMLRQRAWYYTRVYADTHDENVVYVLNVRFWKSKDGGKTFESIRTPHGDHHDLWISPKDPKRLVIGDDGGAQVTFNGGKSWSTYQNQPTAQFYRVTTDNNFPYRIYGAQQDNSSVRIFHRTAGATIGTNDWEPTAGGESGHIAPHPENPDIVYGGSYDGFLTRVDHENNALRLVDVWPDNPMGHGAANLKYRFQWNFPIFFSPHDPRVLFTAANVLFKTTDEGMSWQEISPDLTRNDISKMGPSGGPITKDNTSVEYYGTIFAAAESPYEKDLIWCGSDDGLIHLTRDGGANWENVTPKGMPEWMQINSVEIDPFRKGGLYLAGTRYKSDDFQPYLYRTEDYGKSWKKIVKGIPADHFTRVIRADPKRPGLLFAGTESGIYISFDDGNLWQSFQLDLPIVPITDLALKNDDLIVATQGRSFWVLDDLSPLHQIDETVAAKETHLYTPRPSYRMASFGRGRPGPNEGENLSPGVIVNFYLKDVPKPEEKEEEAGDGTGEEKNKKKNAGEKGTGEEEKKQEEGAVLEFFESGGTLIKKFSSTNMKKDKLDVKKGFNRFFWNTNYGDADDFPGMILWNSDTAGLRALPGTYQVRLTVGQDQQTASFEIVPDPRSQATPEDYRAQLDFLIGVRDKLSETHKAIKRIRRVRAMMARVTKPMKGKETYQDVLEGAKALGDKLRKIEEALYQTKNRSPQDPLNFPIRLNDKLAGLIFVTGIGEYRPTAQAVAVRDLLISAIDEQLTQLAEVLDKDVAAFNALVKSKEIPAIWLVEDEEEDP